MSAPSASLSPASAVPAARAATARPRPSPDTGSTSSIAATDQERRNRTVLAERVRPGVQSSGRERALGSALAPDREGRVLEHRRLVRPRFERRPELGVSLVVQPGTSTPAPRHAATGFPPETVRDRHRLPLAPQAQPVLMPGAARRHRPTRDPVPLLHGAMVAEPHPAPPPPHHQRSRARSAILCSGASSLAASRRIASRLSSRSPPSLSRCPSDSVSLVSERESPT